MAEAVAIEPPTRNWAVAEILGENCGDVDVYYDKSRYDDENDAIT